MYHLWALSPISHTTTQIKLSKCGKTERLYCINCLFYILLFLHLIKRESPPPRHGQSINTPRCGQTLILLNWYINIGVKAATDGKYDIRLCHGWLFDLALRKSQYIQILTSKRGKAKINLIISTFALQFREW